MIIIPTILLLLLALLTFAWWKIFWMPGRSHGGQFKPLSQREAAREQELRADMEHVAVRIGERNVQRKYDELCVTAEYFERELKKAGYQVERMEFSSRGLPVWNLIAEVRGSVKPNEIIIVGAHYDTVSGSPGANDNGSGVVGLLALARAFAGASPLKSIRFVFFVNEEEPYYGSNECGSFNYARRCHELQENIVGMLCLETYGCYTDEPETQHYPKPLSAFFPSTGNFIGFVGNQGSRALVHDVIRAFRTHCDFPSEGVACPERIRDISRSDHAGFWLYGYPALMITDTANFRYKHYHTAQDTIDKINFPAFARVVCGLEKVIADLSK